jgi:hypothetical protein
MRHQPPSPSSRRLPLTAQQRQAAELLMPQLASRRFILCLAAVLIVASGFAGLDLAYRYAEVYAIKLPPQFSLSEDEGLAEWFEYGITASIALVMALRFLKSRRPILAFAAIAFVWLTAENAFQIHEAAGNALAPLFHLSSSAALRASDLGELAFLLASGTIFCAGLAFCLFRSRWSDAPVYLVLACIPAAAVFGVGVDLLHSSLRLGSVAVSQGAAFVEDFGELLMLCLAWALAMGVRPALIS